MYDAVLLDEKVRDNVRVGSSNVRYQISFRLEDESGFHKSGRRMSQTLWDAVKEINDLLQLGAEIISVKKEAWSSFELNKQEKDTIELLTRGKIKL